jgi:hypothetical protein
VHEQHRSRSSALRRLHAAAARAGIRPDERDRLVATVMVGLGARMTETQWRQACGWLPWDVRSLAGTRRAALVAPRDDLCGAVAAATGLPRPVAVVAVRTVLAELARILPPAALPPRLTSGVPGL